ncbi:probable nucleoredoxin 1 [Malus sylvestris]|uniref:probable nucleoredoxin 1 n=1 Tax=Malus sylvestris TaxID=3752 RepID=UPI0021ACCA48|nr:probable nucleoredoxin 1 [Malus sylvestris]
MSDGEANAADAANAKPHDVVSLLSSAERDYLVRNNGDQIKVESLKGKKLGLYFSASWCSPCQQFTPALVEAYNEISPNGDFEIIFISADEDDESFNGYFSKMPWLAIPFSDSDARDSVDGLFKVRGIPHLVILGEDGKVLSDDGVEILQEYGVDSYPFTQEKIKELKDQEEAARREQSLKKILVSRSRDFVISNNGEKVPISELEGKIVGLYFSLSSYSPCAEFTPKLVDVYEKLKGNGENFEIVLLPLDDDEKSFKKHFEKMPWFSLPNGDKNVEKLARYFELSTLPTLVIIGADGKTLSKNVTDAIDEHGSLAYPFTPEKFAELDEIEKAKEKAQTLESLLISGDRNFVIGKDETEVPVTDLVGKNILLYFSAHWCPPCRAFLPKLVEAYHEIKAKDDAFETIFISSDRDQTSFDDFFAKMPWLALPFGDERKVPLSRRFKVQGIPMLVALGPTGKTVTKEARNLVTLHGANAYPFTEERLKEMEVEYEEMAKGWPEKLKSARHEKHELVLTRRTGFTCDKCDKSGLVWSFYCKECNFNLHPKCALEADKETENDAKQEEEEAKEGGVCDGDVCTKA